MIAEIQNAAAKELENLAYLASTEVRAGWEKLETTWLDVEKKVVDEIGAGYELIRKLF